MVSRLIYSNPAPESLDTIEPYLSLLEKHDAVLITKIRQCRMIRGDYPINVFIQCFERIVAEYTIPEQEYLRKYQKEFLSYFQDTETIDIEDSLTTIPKKKLTHVMMSCHFNVSVALLSSLNLLIKEIHKYQETSDEFKTLRETLVEALDCSPSYTIKMLKISKALDINISEFCESTKTFGKLMKVVYEHIPKNLIQYWEASDLFNNEVDKKLDVHQLISKYRPTYLVCDSLQFNAVLGIESQKVSIKKFKIGEIIYQIHAVVVYSSFHFFIAFYDEGMWVIRNDMEQVDQKYKEISDYGGRGDQYHSLMCFVRDPPCEDKRSLLEGKDEETVTEIK